jgi:PAS domain S-box-containing protein
MADSTTILHVDDSRSFTELTATYLERENDRFVVETVASAGKGMEQIMNKSIDCIVSDYNMPGMDGLKFLQAVREEHPDLPFILFTGKGSEEVASDAIAAGVTDYIQKASGSEQYELLANRIENAVKSRHECQRADRQEQLMRLTEFAGDTGGFEVNMDTGELLLTDGACRLVGLPDDADLSLEEGIELYHRDDQADVRQTLNQAAKTGEQTRGTWRLQAMDGDERLVEAKITPSAANGGSTTLRGCIHDVTERRERQQELRRLQESIDNANVPITLADPSQENNPLVYVNDGFEEMTGYPPEETLGRNCRFLQGEDTDPQKVAALREAIDTEETLSVELRNYRKDGTEFWNRLTVTPIYGDNNNLVRYLGTQEDITEQKERERELRAERRFIEQALDTLEDLFYVLDTDGTFRRWNSRLSEITGYADRELADMQATELFPESEREAIADAIRTALADGQATVEADLRTTDGECLPCEFTGAQLTDEDGTVNGLVGVGRDLSERRQRERRFQSLVEESNDVISILDDDGVFQYQSPSIERLLGYSPAETIGDTAWEYIHPDDRADLMESFERWIDRPDANPVVEYRARHADGSWRWLEARGNNQLDNPGVEGYVVNSRDITARKERKQQFDDIEAQQNLEEYRTIVEALADAVYVIDEEGQFTHVNDEFIELVGYDRETIIGNTPSLIKDDDAVERAEHQLGRLLSDGAPETVTFEVEIQPCTGDPIVCEDHMGVLPFDGEEFEGSVGVVRDITERKEYEQGLEAQNERLEEFTSIVSHDLRSPLGVAEGHLELAGTTEEGEHISKAADAIERSQALIDDLLTLAQEGDQVDETEPVGIAEMVESSWQTVEMAQATLDAGEPGVIEADRSRLQELFENLYRNAAEHGGDDVTVLVGGMSNGFYVSDTGPGIPETEREEIFEAGYSTDADGTGFGLRIVEQIAEAHGWEVTVTESEQGGARFEFTGVERVEY